MSEPFRDESYKDGYRQGLVDGQAIERTVIVGWLRNKHFEEPRDTFLALAADDIERGWYDG